MYAFQYLTKNSQINTINLKKTSLNELYITGCCIIYTVPATTL